MPKVPVPQIEEQGFKGPRVSTEQPLAGFGAGRAMERMNDAGRGLTEVVVNIAQDEKKKADMTAFEAADRQASELQTRLQLEVQNLRGRDAAGAIDLARENWDKEMQEIEKGLVNDDQKYLFNRAKTNRWEDLNKTTQVHTSNELRAYADKESEGRIVTSRNAATLNAGDDSRIASEMENIRESVAAWAHRNGLSGSDTEKEKLTKELSATHKDIISARLTANQDIAAKNYYEAAKKRGEISAADMDSLDKEMKIGSTRIEAMRGSEAIWKSSKGDLTSALAMAREKYKDIPDVQDEAIKRIRQRNDDDKAALDAGIRKRFQTASDILQRSKGKEEVPDSIRAGLSIEQQNAIDARRKQLLRGEEPPPNGPDIYRLRRMAGDPSSRGKFNNVDLLLYQHKITNDEMAEMQKAQNGSLKGDDKLLNGFRTKREVVDTTLKSIGVDTTGDNANSEKVLSFYRQVDDEIVNRQRKTGKEITSTEVQEIADQMAKEHVLKQRTFWFDDTKREYEIDIDDVPSDWADNMKAALKADGQDPTDKDIIRFYKMKLRQGKKK